jgi:hypothetical protein
MEATLPNCDRAHVANAKLYRYLLNPEHPDGKSKAQFFALIGYTPDNGEDLRAALLVLACSGTVTKILPNAEGAKTDNRIP